MDPWISISARHVWITYRVPLGGRLEKAVDDSETCVFLVLIGGTDVELTKSETWVQGWWMYLNIIKHRETISNLRLVSGYYMC